MTDRLTYQVNYIINDHWCRESAPKNQAVNHKYQQQQEYQISSIIRDGLTNRQNKIIE